MLPLSPFHIPTTWSYKPGDFNDITHFTLNEDGTGSIMEGRGQRTILNSNLTWTLQSSTSSPTVLSSLYLSNPIMTLTLSITFIASTEPPAMGDVPVLKCGVPVAFTFQIRKGGFVVNGEKMGYEMTMVSETPYEYLCGDDKDTFSVLVGKKEGTVFYAA
ncbi:hypothetical protein BC829DRAFT_415038 [Chytridium lagenaria]|nr:hypothetical protein BC829DRAFT_415038 [Chytridium lagenaria]